MSITKLVMSEQILHQSQSFSQIKFTYIAIPMVG